jgi:hypothetical protein
MIAAGRRRPPSWLMSQSATPHVEEIKQQRSAQPGEGRRSSRRGQPLEMLDLQCPRVVETREPATETTLEDVLARNLSIHRAPHARACGVCQPALQVARGLTNPELSKAKHPFRAGCGGVWGMLGGNCLSRVRASVSPDCRPPPRRHACAAPARPSARSSAPRRRAPAPRRPPRAVRPAQGEAATLVHHAQYLASGPHEWPCGHGKLSARRGSG